MHVARSDIRNEQPVQMPCARRDEEISRLVRWGRILNYNSPPPPVRLAEPTGKNRYSAKEEGTREKEEEKSKERKRQTVHL